MKNLFILNGTSGNRGCEAILLSTYDLIRQAFPNSTFINAAEKGHRDSKVSYLQLPNLIHKPHPHKGLNTSFIHWQIMKRLAGYTWNFEKFLSQADLVFSLGGDNYSMDYGAIDKHLASNDKVLQAGKKLVIWGASIGPFETNSSVENWAKKSFSNCHAVIVREKLSQEYLAALGVTENVYVMPDPAFSLTLDPIALDDDVEKMLGDGAIGFNVSPLLARYRSDPDAWVDEASKWLQAITIKTGSPVLLIPHVMYPGNDDYLFLANVLERAKQRGSAHNIKLIDTRNWSSRNIKYLISRLRAFIGARTHATIAAMSQGVPTLSIGYSIKAKGINLEVFGTDRWVADHKVLDACELANLVGDLISQEDKLRSHLLNKMQTYKMDPLTLAEALGRIARV